MIIFASKSVLLNGIHRFIVLPNSVGISEAILRRECKGKKLRREAHVDDENLYNPSISAHVFNLWMLGCLDS